MIYKYFMIGAVLVGCTTEPSHLPNPLLWPVYGVGSALSNGRYDAKRRVVKAYIHDHVNGLKYESSSKIGAEFFELCKVANINTQNCDFVYKDIKNRQAFYYDQAASVERITVVAMVHAR